MTTAATGRSVGVRAGALMVLAVCFLVSALLRIGDVVAALPGPASAPGMVNEPPDRAVKHAGNDPGNVAGHDAAAGAPGATAVLAELRHQRELLDAREAELSEREQQLKALQIRVKRRLDELRAARDRLAETATVVSDAAGKDVRRLAQMYGQMKPKQAALIFDRMAPSFAAGFLSEMRPEAAALILQNMQPDRAYAVSLMLAGRNVGRDEAMPGTTPAAGP